MWFGAWLVERRKAAGWETQKSFAEDLDISACWLSDIERGAKPCSGRVAVAASELLQVDPALALLRAGLLPEEALAAIEGQASDQAVIAAYCEFIARLRART